MRRGLGSALLVAAMAVLGGAPHARAGAADASCASDLEPNDIGEQAPRLAPPACVTGTLPDGDPIDLWAWTISPEDGRRLWTFTLDGIPGVVTGAQLVPITSEPGATPMTYLGKVFEVLAPHDAPGPVTVGPVLLPPGRFLLALGRTALVDGGGPVVDAYRLEVASAPLPAPADTEPNDDAAHASPLGGAFEVSGELTDSPDLFAWTRTDAEAARSWDLRLQAPAGTGSTVALETVEGELLTTALPDADGVSRLRDLRLPISAFVVRVSGSPATYVLTAAPTGDLAADAEPDDTPARAIALVPGSPARGRLAVPDDRDLYRVAIDEATSEQLLDLRAIWPDGPERTLCLFAPGAGADLGEQLTCTPGGVRGATLRSLALAAGEYLVSVTGAPSEARYVLRLDAVGSAAADFEREPNDVSARAAPFPADVAMRGSLRPLDSDVFRLTTGEPAQLWQVDATGPGLEHVQLIAPDGSILKEATLDAGAFRMSDIYLVPGDHLLRVQGEAGDYRITVTPLGPPVADGELEPNDDPLRAEPMAVGETRTGRLPELSDRDRYRFSLGAAERVRIDLEPAAGGSASVRLMRDTQTLGLAGRPTGTPVSYDAALPPGDYVLVLEPTVPAEGRYRLTLTREDPLTLTADQEPNDSPGWSRPIPQGGVAAGGAISGDDPDWYELAPRPDGAPLQIRTVGAVADLTLWDAGGAGLPLTRASDADPWATGPLPPGAPTYLRVLARGDYTVSVGDPAPAPIPTVPVPLFTSLRLTLDADTVAAAWDAGQTVGGTLHLEGSLGVPDTITLDSVTSQAGWSAELGATDVPLGPGARADVPVTIHVLPDAWPGVPVRITVRARAPDGRQATTWVEVNAEVDAPPVAPGPGWALPAPLLGGLDVASTALGGVPVPSLGADVEARLHDGVTPVGGGLSTRIASLPVSLTVDLAGDAPLPITGTMLHPLADATTLAGIPRSFTLLLSEDGVTWQTALEGELQPLPREQAFALPSPMLARYAQLRIASTWGGFVGELDLGEWKVVAVPGTTPGAASADIADPRVGGHVAWIEPASPDVTFGQGMLDEDPTRQVVFLRAGSTFTAVVGFAHDRAAAIDRLEWVDPPGSDPNARLRAVDLAVSRVGPLGPWSDLGTWQLRRSADGSVEPFQPGAPTWARFLRLTADAPRADRHVELPATLRVLEQPASADHPSVLGEWGGESPDGPLEWAEPPDHGPPVDDPDAPDDPVDARPLVPGQRVGGLVTIGADVDWYAVTVPPDANSLTITVGGTPSVRARATLSDADGRPVPLRPGPRSDAGAQTFSAPVEGGATYRVRVEQAPFSLVVAFDTSGSLGSYLTYIQLALRSYARGIVPGAEVVLVQPFEEPPLVPDWTDDAYLLENAAALYAPPADGSSAVEIGVLDAIDHLDTRDGGRAILLMTDAETTSAARNGEMWRALEAQRPSLFTLLVAGTGTPLADRRTMQDLALVAGGTYAYAGSQSEVDRAFHRAGAWLRRPAGYTLLIEPSKRVVPPIEPGRLSVVARPGPGQGPTPIPVARDAAIEIILDTSGSMLDRQGRRRRIDIAKAVLTDLVRNVLPARTPLALRVFGDAQDVCGTRLAVPLGPLDPDRVTGLVRDVTVVRAADTPIAAAIAAVGSDLSASAQTRVVVMITDAEEVWPHADLCGRDPKDAIAELAAQGVEVRLNIVGFGLSGKRAKAQMREWARLGNGRFFEAGDQATLERSLASAMSVPFQVVDAAGAVVASGVVGGPAVSLPPGTYTVVVLTEPEVRFADVVVDSAGSVELVLP